MALRVVEQWVRENGLDVDLLEPAMDDAFLGVVAGDVAHHALYDPERIIALLTAQGLTPERARAIFDVSYYPQSEHLAGPRFLLKVYPVTTRCQDQTLHDDIAPAHL